MPSGGQKPISMEEAAQVAGVAKLANDHGLLTEWFAFFIGGMLHGEQPLEAADNAALEWDIAEMEPPPDDCNEFVDEEHDAPPDSDLPF